MKGNSANPFQSNPTEVEHIATKPPEKGEVISVGDNELHTATVKLYESGGQKTFPVIVPAYGDVALPQVGTDVRVVYDHADNGFVIGGEYMADRIQRGETTIPNYTAGDRIVGNETESFIRIGADGHIDIRTEGNKPVNVDSQSVTVTHTTDQSVADTGAWVTVAYDTVKHGREVLFNGNSDIVPLYDGLYTIDATVEIQNAGQNFAYALAIFVNDTLVKRKFKQSVNAEPLSIDIHSDENVTAGDSISIRIQNNSNQSRIIGGDATATDFSVNRHGLQE